MKKPILSSGTIWFQPPNNGTATGMTDESTNRATAS